MSSSTGFLLVFSALLAAGLLAWSIRWLRRTTFRRAVVAARSGRWSRAVGLMSNEYASYERAAADNDERASNLQPLAGFRALKIVQLWAHLGNQATDGLGKRAARLVAAISPGDHRLFDKVAQLRQGAASVDPALPVVPVLPYLCVCCFSGLTEVQFAANPRCACGAQAFLAFRRRVIPSGPSSGEHFHLELVQKGGAAREAQA